MDYLNRLKLFKSVDKRSMNDTAFKERMPPRSTTGRSLADFLSPIVKAAYDDDAGAIDRESFPALQKVLFSAASEELQELVFGKGSDSQASEPQTPRGREAEALTSQANGLCALFADEQSLYDRLVEASNPNDQASLEELTSKLMEQQGRVASLKGQLDSIIAQLTAVQEAYDNSDDPSADSSLYFSPNNERDDATDRPGVFKQPADSQRIKTSPELILPSQREVYDVSAEKSAQSTEENDYRVTEDFAATHRAGSQGSASEPWAEPSGAVGQGFEGIREQPAGAHDVASSLSEPERELRDELVLSGFDQDLLLTQCIAAASSQQALDNKAEKLDNCCANFAAKLLSLDAQYEVADAHDERLHTAHEELLSQQEAVNSQLLQLTAMEEQLAVEQDALRDRALSLDRREAGLGKDRAALEVQAQAMEASSAAAASSTGQDPEAQHRATASQSAVPQTQCETLSRKRSPEEERASNALAALELRQSELEQQKQALHQRHGQLAADLSSKQMGLNEQWAALDIDQSRAQAKEQYLQSQSKELQQEWQVLEEEWAALETQKAELKLFQAAEVDAGVDSEHANQSHDNSDDKRLADIDGQEAKLSAEWAALHTEKSKLASERHALSLREEALAKAAAATNTAEWTLLLGVPVEGNARLPPIATRGDSPRDLQAPKMWSGSQGTSSEGALSDCLSVSENGHNLDLFSGGSASSICGFTYIRDRAEKMRHERTKLWASAADPGEMQRRLKRIQEMEQLQSQREMMLEAREAVDFKQLEEMNLSRSLALDTREKSLKQQEAVQREALSKMLTRDAEVASLRRKVESLEKQLRRAAGAEFAAISDQLRVQSKKPKSWAKMPERGSLMDPLWQQGLDVQEVYSTNGSL